jgi:hypothetical protein
MRHSVGRTPLSFANAAICAFSAFRVSVARVQCERRTVRRERCQLVVIDVDRNHLRAERPRNLYAVATDTAGADDDRQRARLDAGAAHGLIRGGQRIGDDRHLRQRQADGRQALGIDLAQAAARHDDVRREAAMHVVARHLLLAADRR